MTADNDEETTPTLEDRIRAAEASGDVGLSMTLKAQLLRAPKPAPEAGDSFDAERAAVREQIVAAEANGDVNESMRLKGQLLQLDRRQAEVARAERSIASKASMNETIDTRNANDHSATGRMVTDMLDPEAQAQRAALARRTLH